MPHNTKLPVHDDIAAVIGAYALFSAIEERVEEINVDPPLTRNERHMIIKLSQPQRIGVLAEAMAIAPSTATAVIDALTDRNLTYREHDENDRRAWKVGLTSEGRKVQSYFVVQAEAALRQSTGLSPRDNEQLKKLLKKIHDHLPKEFRKT